MTRTNNLISILQIIARNEVADALGIRNTNDQFNFEIEILMLSLTL